MEKYISELFNIAKTNFEQGRSEIEYATIILQLNKRWRV